MVLKLCINYWDIQWITLIVFFKINLSIKGMAILKPYCVKQSCAITPELLIDMSSVLNLSDHSDIVHWCLFLFAFFLFARKSNLVPNNKKDLRKRNFY